MSTDDQITSLRAALQKTREERDDALRRASDLSREVTVLRVDRDHSRAEVERMREREARFDADAEELRVRMDEWLGMDDDTDDDDKPRESLRSAVWRAVHGLPESEARSENLPPVSDLLAAVERLRAVAYIGDHCFPDMTWRSRCEETATDLRDARDEVERMRRDCEVTADELAEERTRNISLEGQMERLRAVIEGRTTPPTDAEIDAHAAAGGSWDVTVTATSGANCTMLPSDPRMVRDMRDGEVMTRGEAKTWRARDAQRRPCAWPTVTP